MATTIQLRRDTSTNWTSTNPVLHSGEPGLETDTGKNKLGDGVTAWNSLSYNYNGLTFIRSLVQTGPNVNLVNDNTSPGNSKYYGTNSTGVKGFFTISAGGGGNIDSTTQMLQGDGTGNAVGSNVEDDTLGHLTFRYDDASTLTTVFVKNLTDGSTTGAQVQLLTDTYGAILSVYSTSTSVGLASGGDCRLYADNKIIMASNGGVIFSNDGGTTEIGRISDALRLVPVASFPGTPAEGMIVAKTDNHLYYYNGSSWKQLDN